MASQASAEKTSPPVPRSTPWPQAFSFGAALVSCSLPRNSRVEGLSARPTLNGGKLQVHPAAAPVALCPSTTPRRPPNPLGAGHHACVRGRGRVQHRFSGENLCCVRACGNDGRGGSYCSLCFIGPSYCSLCMGSSSSSSYCVSSSPLAPTDCSSYWSLYFIGYDKNTDTNMTRTTPAATGKHH